VLNPARAAQALLLSGLLSLPWMQVTDTQGPRVLASVTAQGKQSASSHAFHDDAAFWGPPSPCAPLVEQQQLMRGLYRKGCKGAVPIPDAAVTAHEAHPSASCVCLMTPGHLPLRPHRCCVHGPWPEVHQLQGRLPLQGHPGHGLPICQPPAVCQG